MTSRTWAVTLLVGRLLSQLVGAACLVVAGWYGWNDLTLKGVIAALVGLILTTAPSLVRGVHVIKMAGQMERDHALTVLAEATYEMVNFPEDNDVRITVLRPSGRSERRLVQAARFAKKNGLCVRDITDSSMRVSQGYAGQCYNGKKLVVKVRIDDFYRDMEILGFSEGEARRFRSDRKTYACLPILDETAEHAMGVLSLDAKIAETFTDQRIQIIERFLPLYARLFTGPRPKEGEV